MGLFSSKKPDEKPSLPVDSPASGTRVSNAPSVPTTPRVGIDHAIHLMRSLPTDQNPTLVVTVLKTTLESLGIHVVEIVEDAKQRQQDIEARVAQLKGEIGALEKEVDLRIQEITRLETAHAETTKVKSHLEGGAIEVATEPESESEES